MQGVKPNIIDTGKVKHYRFMHKEASQLQGLDNENQISAELDLTFVKATEEGTIFYVKTRNYLQSNTDGMFGWVNDLKPLTEELQVMVSPQGILSQVLNLNQIREKWDMMKKDLAKKHRKENQYKNFIKKISELLEDKQRLAESLRYTHPYIQLFPGFTDKTFSKNDSHTGYRELPNFLGVKFVPINTTEKLREYNLSDGTYQIECQGEIDQEKLDQVKMRAFVKSLQNKPKLRSNLELKYTERHAYDRNHWPEQCMRLSMSAVPGFLYRKEETFLKAIA